MSMERESTGGAVLVDPLGGLVLDPANELRFRGPFDDYITDNLVKKTIVIVMEPRCISRVLNMFKTRVYDK